MKLTINEISEYRKCPLSYFFKYVQAVPDEGISLQLSDKLHEIVTHFFTEVKENRDIPTVEELKAMWEGLWFSDVEPLEYMLTPRNDRLEAGQRAVPMISNFYTANYLSPGMPLVVNQPFTVELGDHEVSGVLELVREVQDGPRRVVEIVDYRTGQQTPTQWVIDYDLILSLQSYAFREMAKAKEQRVSCHYLKSNKVIQSHRSKEHYKRMKSTIDMIAKDIARGIFYPRETYICNACEYKNYCESWYLE